MDSDIVKSLIKATEPPPSPIVFVYVVTDYTEYVGENILAAFSTEEKAITYADYTDLYTDARYICKAALDNPDDVTATDYCRKR